jgi:hypothetical protein
MNAKLKKTLTISELKKTLEPETSVKDIFTWKDEETDEYHNGGSKAVFYYEINGIEVEFSLVYELTYFCDNGQTEVEQNPVWGNDMCEHLFANFQILDDEGGRVPEAEIRKIVMEEVGVGLKLQIKRTLDDTPEPNWKPNS